MGSWTRWSSSPTGRSLGTDTTAPYSYSWSNVPAGTYSVNARAIDDDGAGASSAARSIEVTSPPPPPNGTGTRLSAQYFDSRDFSGSSVSRIDPQVDFAWGSGSPAPTINPDDFSARWSGELEPRCWPRPTMAKVSDDGIRLWLDGQLVIDNWVEHWSTEDAVSVALQAGRRYVVKLEYFGLASAATARAVCGGGQDRRRCRTALYRLPRRRLRRSTRRPRAASSPAAGSKYAAPAIVSLAASASDSDGSVSRVEFLANGTLLEPTSAPYEYSWTDVPTGTTT